MGSQCFCGEVKTSPFFTKVQKREGLKMLKNVVGLVTGGSSGLGRATVDRSVREGAKVTLLDLPSSKGADVAKELGEDNCIFIPGDVTKEDSVKTALEEGKAKWG